MAMAEAKTTRRRTRSKPVIELECSAFQVVAHHHLNAVELTVVDQDGRGFRTWVGADIAPTAALRFCAAVVRLVSIEVT
jgi:hypothetical protein